MWRTSRRLSGGSRSYGGLALVGPGVNFRNPGVCLSPDSILPRIHLDVHRSNTLSLSRLTLIPRPHNNPLVDAHIITGEAMATNRTATTKWRKIRDERRCIALDEGIHNCPRCKVPLDWEYSRRPNSAEVDHIKSHSQGGQDELSNTQILCRQCNQSLGGKQGAKNKAKPKTISLTTTIEW